MELPRIAPVLNWRNKTRQSGVYPLHIRIKIGQSARYYRVPIPQKIRLDQWKGDDDAWVKPSHPFAFEINNKIRELKGALLDLIKRSYSFDRPLTFEMMFRHLNNKGDASSFYSYMGRFIKRPPEKLELNTIKKYSTCLVHLQAFRPSLFFSQIDNTVLKDFLRYMQTDLNLKGVSCKKYLECFKRVIRQARKDHLIDASQMEFLFDDVKVKVNQAKRVFLEPQEIKALKNLKFPETKKYLARDRDLFLFQIYTGYYYKDLLIFTKNQLLHDEEFGLFIVGSRDKNGNQTIIPLFKFPYAIRILDAYKSEESEDTVFSQEYLLEEPVYNRHLKEIASLAGIKKNISNKTARHTNAQLWVRYGAERPILSKMLGHIKEETTKNYFSVNIPEIVEGTKRANFESLGI